MSLEMNGPKLRGREIAIFVSAEMTFLQNHRSVGVVSGSCALGVSADWKRRLAVWAGLGLALTMAMGPQMCRIDLFLEQTLTGCGGALCLENLMYCVFKNTS